MRQATGSSDHDVDAFRRRTQRKKRSDRSRPLLRPEKLTIAGLCLLICLAPWMIGSMKAGPQVVLFVISAFTFLQLFIPAHKRDEYPRQCVKRLMRSPVFWTSLLFLLYLLIQALNPALAVRHKDIDNWWHYHSAWWMTSVSHISWLPTGVSAPFAEGNAWRAIMNWLTALLAMWAAFVGIRSRQSIVTILWCVCLNGGAVAMVGLMQRATGTEFLLWTFVSTNKAFFGPFHYPNHAGAYLYPVLALCAGMFFYYQREARRKLLRSHAGVLFIFLGVGCCVGAAATASRGTILIAAAILLAFVLLYIIQLFYSSDVVALGLGLMLLAILLLGGGYCIYHFSDSDKIRDRFESLYVKGDSLKKDQSFSMRSMIMKATWEMSDDRPYLGWGVGSYKWVFRNYQLKKKYEPLLRRPMDRRYGTGYQYFSISYAHSDLLQYLAEYGIVGSSFLLGIALSWLGLAIYYIRALTAAQVMIFIGCLASVAHATFEFNFSNPSVLILVSMMGALGVIWMKLNPRFQSGDDYA